MTAPIPPARIAEFRIWIKHWRGGGPSAGAIARGFEELLEERERLQAQVSALRRELGKQHLGNIAISQAIGRVEQNTDAMIAKINTALGKKP